MRDAQLKRDKLFKENRKNECKRLRDSNCTTLMLIVVVTVFLMTEIPLAVMTVSNFLKTLKGSYNNFERICYFHNKLNAISKRIHTKLSKSSKFFNGFTKHHGI